MELFISFVIVFIVGLPMTILETITIIKMLNTFIFR